MPFWQEFNCLNQKRSKNNTLRSAVNTYFFNPNQSAWANFWLNLCLSVCLSVCLSLCLCLWMRICPKERQKVIKVTYISFYTLIVMFVITIALCSIGQCASHFIHTEWRNLSCLSYSHFRLVILLNSLSFGSNVRRLPFHSKGTKSHLAWSSMTFMAHFFCDPEGWLWKTSHRAYAYGATP